MEPPKSSPNGSCSDDLERARRLSRALRGETPAATGPAPAAPEAYVSFGAVRAAPVAPPTVPPAPRPQLPLMTRREPLRAPAPAFGSAGWNKLLDACVAATTADAAFFMDPQGLIIASRGPRAGDDLEGVGAKLMAAFDQADRIEGLHSTLSMTVETARGTLHALRLAQPDGSLLTLGLVVAAGLTAERQARLLTLITAATLAQPT
jgi:hypothetical protein